SNELSCVDAGSSTRLPGVCPVSRPRRTHARVRRRREPDAKRAERNAYNAELVGRCAASQGSAGLASCYPPHPLRLAMTAAVCIRGKRSGLNKALPHDSLTTTTQLFE